MLKRCGAGGEDPPSDVLECLEEDKEFLFVESGSGKFRVGLRQLDEHPEMTVTFIILNQAMSVVRLRQTDFTRMDVNDFAVDFKAEESGQTNMYLDRLKMHVKIKRRMGLSVVRVSDAGDPGDPFGGEGDRPTFFI